MPGLDHHAAEQTEVENNAVGYSITEILLFRITGHVGEGQHCN